MKVSSDRTAQCLHAAANTEAPTADLGGYRRRWGGQIAPAPSVCSFLSRREAEAGQEETRQMTG